MAHRKLQQEIDRVFKKINEGLEIFDTYYERHENCTNNPSQKDKLESDLKREVKKLQRLREQIKSWQSSPEIKDKDSLLDYRRSVETAMEKYKAVEKASKEKAYSNISLKKSDLLDPQERERRDVSEFLSGTIDELERQYDGLQVEVDRLILLNKKKKTASSANEQQKEQLKALQARYRWHQQQIELALRLLANEELDPDSVKEVQDDINYFVDSNQDPDFVEDETIYDALNLQSNEAIAHEVAQYFASQLAEDNADEEDSRDASKLSKKEQRKLERDAKKAAKAAAKSKPEEEVLGSPVDESEAVELPKSKSASPEQKTTEPMKSVPSSAAVPATTKSPNGLGATIPRSSSTSSTPSNNNHELHSGHTHIHQSLNGVTTTSTLKPATVPIRPAGELKWAVAASQGVEKDKKISSSISATNVAGTVNNQTTASSTSASSAISSRATSATNTPRLAAQSLEPSNLAQLDNSAQYGSSNSLSANTAAAVLAAGAAAVHLNNKSIHRNNSSSHQLAEALNHRNLSGDSSSKADVNQTENLEDVSAPDLVIDDYEPELTDDEIENEPVPEHLSAEEYIKRTEAKEQMRKELIEDYELLLLPSGIQEFIMGTHLFTKGLEPLDGKVGGFRRSCDTCNIPRFDEVPLGVNPPAPLDAFRSTQQWDITRCSLRSIIQNGDLNDNEKYEAIIEKFRSLEMFTLFYNYYFAVTPLEQTIASLVLSERNWKVSKSGTLWFLRQGEPKFANEVCEVADYKIFKLDDWTVADKPNFKLDYAALKEAPATLPSAQKDQSIDTNGLNDLSHGQQLLQQLKQGKIAVSD